MKAKVCKHLFNIHHQYTQLQFLHKSLKEDEAIIHIDYAENWQCKYAKECPSREVNAVVFLLTQLPEAAVGLSHCRLRPLIVHGSGDNGADGHIERRWIRSMRASICPTMAAGDSPEATSFVPMCKDHQSLSRHSVESPGVLLQAPPEESAGVDVCRREIRDVLLNTPAHGV
ncbi:hypothetical protein KUCAC02_031995 [Chaenocephalus aceratus]|nr:hypothetical protein KUCAC02_031995 [Chaenocephalus aceratus]